MLADRRTDPSLHPYLQASTDAAADGELQRLLRVLEPQVRGVVARRWAGERDLGQEVERDILAKLVARLVELRRSHCAGGADGSTDGSAAIQDLTAFAAVTSHRVCDNYVRRKRPNWTRLKRQVEYVLAGRTGAQGFAVWSHATRGRICGFVAWKNAGHERLDERRYRRLLEDPCELAAAAFPGEAPEHLPLGELIAGAFRWIGGPLPVDALVRVLAVLRNVQDHADQPLVPDASEDAGQTPSLEDEVVARDYLRRLWGEIRQLPPHQGAALLLNLRDAAGRGVVALLPLQQIASVREIAAAVGIEAREFARLWNGLPLEDQAIAELLGCSRQQVINMRRSARDRLERRMRRLSDENGA